MGLIMALKKEVKKTLIYVLLPEYVDVSHCTSSVALTGKGQVSVNVSDYKKVLSQIKGILSFFGYEHIYPIYDFKNLKSFVWPLKTVEDIYPDGKLFIKNMMRNIGWTTAEDVSCSSPGSFMLYGADVSQEVIGDIASRQCFGNAVVILDIDSLSSKNSPLLVKEKYSGNPIDIVTAKNIRELYEWLSTNRIPQRLYCFNEKHGDMHHIATVGSQLRTDEGQTKELLRYAVGETKVGPLWLYDRVNSAYIYFENQRELRLAFHGYHINEGDENAENINLDKLRTIGNL